MIAARGLLSIATAWFSIDAFAHSVTTMMGLALGVDYALLIVSRFREELAAGATPLDAARATRRTAGRTTAFAGSTLLLSMLVAFFIVPGSLLASLAASLALVVVLSVLVATVAAPAVLTLLGPNVDRWRIGPAQANGRSRLMTLVTAALRRPAPVAAAIGAVVLLLAAPAIALKTGPPSQEQLSPSDPARRDLELIDREIGPGWDAGFVVVAATKDGTMTEPSRLAALSRWQRRIAALPGVQAVIGPAQIAHAVAPLRETGAKLLASGGRTGPVGSLGRLGHNLGRAAGGVAQLRAGISQASSGAGLLAQGSGRAEEGAGAIAAGLERATAGGGRAVGALEAFASGARRLADADRRAALGALVIKFGVHDLVPNLRHNALRRSRGLQKSLNGDAREKLPQLQAAAQVADEELKKAVQQLEAMTVGKTDPSYGAALDAARRADAAVSGTDPVSGQPYAPGYAGLPAELAALQSRLLVDAEEAQQVTAWLETAITGLQRLTSVSRQLSAGLGKIENGGGKLAAGSARLAAAASTLASGLTRLGVGATSLTSGISQLGGGASALQRRLAEGFHRAYPLQAGLRRAAVRVVSNDASLKRQTARLRRSSPGLFDSGYFVLSALDGAPPRLRDRAADRDRPQRRRPGGDAAGHLPLHVQLPRLDRPQQAPRTRSRPRSAAKRASRPASPAEPRSSTTTARSPGNGSPTWSPRSPSSPSSSWSSSSAPCRWPRSRSGSTWRPSPSPSASSPCSSTCPRTGHWAATPTSTRSAPMMIFGVVFGLSIDYAVFLLVRMRERYDARRGPRRRDRVRPRADRPGDHRRGGDHDGRLHRLRRRARSRRSASSAIGLTVAVLLDATVVRIVLLPALMLLLGERVWWMPRPLARALPRLNV